MTSHSIQKIVNEIIHARKTGQKISVNILNKKTDAELYFIAKELEVFYNKLNTKCIKLGSTTHRSRDSFKNNTIIFGSVINKYLYKNPTAVKNIHKAEAEIFFRVKKGFKSESANCLKDIFSHFGYAIDFPYSCLDKSIFPYFIADMCGSGKVAISDDYHINNFNEHENFKLLIGSKFSEDSYSSQFIYSERSFIKNLLRVLKKNNFNLVSGQIILSGGITSCMDLDDARNLKLYVSGKKIFDLNLEN